MEKPKYYVGIDISSADFAVSVWCDESKIILPTREFTNEPDSFTKMMSWLQKHHIQELGRQGCFLLAGFEGCLFYANAGLL